MNELANANNGFGFDLFFQLDTEQNIVISPSSIALALAMICNGTEGETLAEVIRVLNLEQFELDVDASYARFIETLENTDADVKLAIANSLWVDRDIALKDRFIDNAKEFYRAEVTRLNFS